MSVHEQRSREFELMQLLCFSLRLGVSALAFHLVF